MREKPTPPSDGECCESGCCPCVWDIYYEEMDKWRQEQAEAAQNAEAKDQNQSQDQQPPEA